ncbi:L-aspartate oxidase [Aureimonas frigidaquae]|uniref:L-aspartate oxidase n=1 Tax=Aureimonas frigidaquae TaxID=424757 RepID=UPI00078242A7|nr:L-aspartate oxidase [Aureimonas frigidaquae]
MTGRSVIVGAGIAGAMTALALQEDCVLVCAGALGSLSSSRLAQGGVAAAIGPGDDAAQHLNDTLAAGDGLCDAAAAGAILSQAPAAVARLESLGVRFDRGPDGAHALGLEAAHGQNRILHVAGDGTGADIMRALTQALRRAAHVTIIEHAELVRLHVREGRIAGVLLRRPSGPLTLATGRLVLATGGVGGLFPATTNPLGNTGRGLALAARAGALIRDAEFVQFHPTALDCTLDPLPLVSEAVRGEGAVLIDDAGMRFMSGIAGRELAPRDVVARAIQRRIAAGARVFLDARPALGRHFATRFPGIDALCRAQGIDPAQEPIPVRPAAHYHMGGIAVDAEGRSSLPGLWAVGEVAATGLHGANRLASNSLLEGAVCGPRVAASLERAAREAPPAPAHTELPPPDPALPQVRAILGRALMLEREGGALAGAVLHLRRLAPRSDAAAAALMIAAGALARRESRGAHCRTDYPATLPAASTLSTYAQAMGSAEADPLALSA